MWAVVFVGYGTWDGGEMHLDHQALPRIGKGPSSLDVNDLQEKDRSVAKRDCPGWSCHTKIHPLLPLTVPGAGNLTAPMPSPVQFSVRYKQKLSKLDHFPH